jgi:hypothetical protein
MLGRRSDFTREKVSLPSYVMQLVELHVDNADNTDQECTEAAAEALLLLLLLPMFTRAAAA